MKNIFKLMTVAALCAALSACGEKDPGTQPSGKPVITPDMFSVNPNAETGVVVFQFLNASLTPFWTVTDPNNSSITFTDRNVTKTFELKGLYSVSLVAFGAAGQSDPVTTNFVVGNSEWDPDLSFTENVLMANTWKPYYIGWWGGEGEEYWDWEDKAPGYLFDDRIVFKKGGAIEWNQAETFKVYDDVNDAVDYTFSGNEKWAYVVEDGKEYLQFSNGGFPGILGDEGAVNAKYLITNVTANSISLNYYEAENEQWIYVTLTPEDWVEPAPSSDVTVEAAQAALSGKKFQISELGWWGEGWEYLTVKEEGELPAYMLNDFITFNADGSLVYDLSQNDPPVEEGGTTVSRIYNDGVKGGEIFTATGNEKWAVVSDAGATKISFSDGGFPLAMAGKGEPGTEFYHFGMDAKWTVSSISEEGTLRLDIFQTFTGEQWLVIFLTPVAQ